MRSMNNTLNSIIFNSDEDDNQSQRLTVSAVSSLGRKKNNNSRKKSRLRFQRTYACKTVVTTDIKQKQLTEMMNEIYIMRTLDHPYIIRLYEVYQVKRK